MKPKHNREIAARVIGAALKRAKYDSAKLHTSTRLRYALCDADGKPALIAHDPELCLAWFASMRGHVKFSESEQFGAMVRAGWSIRHIETTVLTGKSIEAFADYRKTMVAESRRSTKNGALT